MRKLGTLAFLILGFVASAICQEGLNREVKCLVCRISIREIEKKIKKVDPKKKIEVSGFRMDSKDTKMVPYVKSEMFLTELMEEVCNEMDDYAKARYKDTHKLTVLKFIDDDGKMNPDVSKVDFIQDGDLNKSLKHYCLEILEDHEDVFLEHYMSDELPDHPEYRICHLQAKYCNSHGTGVYDGDGEYGEEEDDEEEAEQETDRDEL